MFGIDLLSPVALSATVLATVIIFAATAFFTRATLRRTVGALVAAAPLVLLVMGIDSLAERAGWWRYPSLPGGQAPLAWYVAGALVYGGGVGLIGWRVLRRYGPRSLVTFAVIVGFVGVSRDYAYSVTTHLIEFGRGPLPLVADFCSYAVASVIVQAILWWGAGPPRSDPLARRH
jgi:hypothetical protein